MLHLPDWLPARLKVCVSKLWRVDLDVYNIMIYALFQTRKEKNFKRKINKKNGGQGPRDRVCGQGEGSGAPRDRKEILMRRFLHKANRVGGGYSYFATLCADTPEEEKVLFATHKLLTDYAPAERGMGFENGVLEVRLEPDEFNSANPAM